MGMILGVLVLPANLSDDFGAKHLLRRIAFAPRWALFLFDGGYDKPPLIHWCEQLFGVRVEISRRLGKEFEVLPKRWIVERTFGWLNFARRLSKDYEARPDVSESMIYVAMIHVMLKRLHSS
jgi:putative transposase